jgi:hypothetical protein
MPFSDNVVAFIDNADDRMVIEYDAEYFESKYEDPNSVIYDVLAEKSLQWTIARVEYTGETYIITIERLWV